MAVVRAITASRSGAIADSAVMTSSVAASPRYSWAVSPVELTNGITSSLIRDRGPGYGAGAMKVVARNR
jgi:hypothetical protein